jgi:hypothetical protein
MDAMQGSTSRPANRRTDESRWVLVCAAETAARRDDARHDQAEGEGDAGVSGGVGGNLEYCDSSAVGEQASRSP